jgi:hypothetical protein
LKFLSKSRRHTSVDGAEEDIGEKLEISSAEFHMMAHDKNPEFAEREGKGGKYAGFRS